MLILIKNNLIAVAAFVCLSVSLLCFIFPLSWAAAWGDTLAEIVIMTKIAVSPVLALILYYGIGNGLLSYTNKTSINILSVTAVFIIRLILFMMEILNIRNFATYSLFFNLPDIPFRLIMDHIAQMMPETEAAGYFF